MLWPDLVTAVESSCLSTAGFPTGSCMVLKVFAVVFDGGWQMRKEGVLRENRELWEDGMPERFFGRNNGIQEIKN